MKLEIIRELPELYNSSEVIGIRILGLDEVRNVVGVMKKISKDAKVLRLSEGKILVAENDEIAIVLFVMDEGGTAYLLSKKKKMRKTLVWSFLVGSIVYFIASLKAVGLVASLLFAAALAGVGYWWGNECVRAKLREKYPEIVEFFESE